MLNSICNTKCFPRWLWASLMLLSSLGFAGQDHELRSLLQPRRTAQDCVLVDPANLICHVASNGMIYRGLVKGARIISKDIAHVEALRGGSDAPVKIWNLDAQRKEGRIFASWLAEKSGQFSLEALYINRDGTVTRHTVKKFPEWDPIFELRTAVRDDAIIFFFLRYTEKHFSPISDRSNRKKLWTITWRDRDGLVSETPLTPERGTETIAYDFAATNAGSIQMALIDERRGSRELRIGRLYTDQAVIFKQSASRRLANAAESEPVYLQPTVVGVDDIHFGVLVPRADSENSVLYELLDETGQSVRDLSLKVKPRQLMYDKANGRLRYLDGDLQSTSGSSISATVKIHWVDLSGKEESKTLSAPAEAIHIDQRLGDCFYWLQPSDKALVLRHVCR